MKILILTLLSFISSTAYCQLEFHRSNEYPVSKDGTTLPYAWAGGLNSSQWSTIDLNIDGVEDLFIYDRTSDQIQTYLKDPLSGEYELSFGYASSFPSISDWILLRDFNCDGKKDIFTHTSGGIKVYENTSVNGELDFTLRSSLVQSYRDFGSEPYYSSIYVSSQDIPSIDDFDGDGDLDIHTFTLSGLTIEYHQNFAIENGQCDSLDFVMRNRCYAMIGEDAVSPQLYIGQDFIDEDFCTFNVVDPKSTSAQEDSKDGLHSGSTLCVFDYDGNGQKDLLLGDISATDMKLAYIDDRGPLIDSAFATEVDFPQADTPIDLHIFNAAFFEDLDNDGIRDLLVSPANKNESEDFESSWLYKNTGSNDDVNLELVTTDFIQGEMLDNGTSSFVRYLDYNADGLTDLLLSNRGKYQPGGTYAVSLWLLENTGSANAPSFTIVTENFMDLNNIGLGAHMVPTFGDLDDDGDQDMFIGDGRGRLYYFENAGGAGNEVVYNDYQVLTESEGDTLDLGANLTPQLFDLDDDGRIDLLVGERNGNTNYLRNVGSTTEFEFELVEDTIGDIVTDLDGNLIGYSSPWFFRDDLGNLNALFGTEKGQVFYLDDISPSDVTGTWSVTDSSAFGISNGNRASPVLIDMDEDQMPEIFNGGLSGGFGLYKGGSEPNSIPDLVSAVSFDIFPNPSEEEVYIQINSDSVYLYDIQLWDVSGRLILFESSKEPSSTILDLSQQSQGLYVLRLNTSRGPISRSIVKK
jgi:hypothetical protein